MSATNGSVETGNRVQNELAEIENRDEIVTQPNDVLASLLAKYGSKGRIKGTLIVKGIEASKVTLRSGMSTYTEDEFDKAVQSAGMDVTRTVDVTFHGVFRAKSHTDRVIGDNAMEFIAELKDSNLVE